jgi:transcriptional regulator with XRE-family HTH domain
MQTHSLLEQMQSAGITQYQVAKRLGVRESIVWRVVHDRGSSHRVVETITSMLKEKQK